MPQDTVDAPAADPDPPSAVSRAFGAGRLDAASDLCDAALGEDQRQHGLHNARAVVRRAAGDIVAAVASYRRAIALAPGEPTYYVNYANALLARDRPGRARGLVLTALRLRPRHVGHRLVLAECHYRDRRFADARAIVAPLAAARPDVAQIRYVEGNIGLQEGDHAAAAVAFRRSLALHPAHGMAWMNLGSALRLGGDLDGAVRCYETAARCDPRNTAARKVLASTLLAAGQLAEGWDAYEERWSFPEFPSPRRQTGRPLWDGTPRPGTRLLVWPEQGVGDQITYASCVPDLLRTGQQVILECDARLVPLFRHSFPGAAVRAATHDSRGRELLAEADYDVHLPIASLARLYRRSLDAFPIHGGYLRPSPAAADHWRRRVASLGPGLKVGIAWRSGDLSGDRGSHYAPLEAWRPVLSVPGVTFVNLQYGTRDEDRSAFRERFGLTLAEWPDLDLKNDFMGVAALIEALDLVVTGPCAACAQAGSLGKPVWVVDGPPMHFKYLGTGRMPWFPSWRPFTKRVWAEPWDRVFSEVAATLRARAAGEAA